MLAYCSWKRSMYTHSLFVCVSIFSDTLDTLQPKVMLASFLFCWRAEKIHRGVKPCYRCFQCLLQLNGTHAIHMLTTHKKRDWGGGGWNFRLELNLYRCKLLIEGVSELFAQKSQRGIEVEPKAHFPLLFVSSVKVKELNWGNRTFGLKPTLGPV